MPVAFAAACPPGAHRRQLKGFFWGRAFDFQATFLCHTLVRHLFMAAFTE